MSEIRMYCPCSLQGLYELMMVIFRCTGADTVPGVGSPVTSTFRELLQKIQ